MGSVYLTGLAAWCREAGLTVIEVDGWQTRARGSGGYDSGRPWCIMWHHTASKTSAENDVNYICFGNPDAPVSNLYLARNGDVHVCAAGATNTNGKGGPVTMSKGTIPLDSMNTYAVGIEAGNDGVGEPWPQAQIDAYFALNNILTAKLGLRPSDCCTHQVWAPSRKIDPATAAAVQGPWRPDSTTSSGTWSLTDVQDEAIERATGTLPPPDPSPPLPPPEDDDMQRITAALDKNGTIWIGDGITRRALDSMEQFSNYVILGSAGCYQFVNTSGGQVRELGHVQTVGDITIEALGKP